MGEKFPVLDKTEVQYNGILNIRDFYKLIIEWLKDHKYDITIKSNSEEITPNGRNATVKLEANKKINDYVKYTLKIEIKLKNVIDIDIEQNGKKHKLNKASTSIAVQAILNTDYGGKWEDSVMKWLIRAFVDKYLMKLQFKDYKKELENDAKILLNQVKTFFNMEHEFFMNI